MSTENPQPVGPMSGLSMKAPSASYGNSVLGTLGSFKTSAGRVDFLETKARLEQAGLSPEFRLTSFLTPVREALPVQGMNFNQLLQRDLDDHRVAVDLIPYLLQPSKAGPAFFPPIVAVLLPFFGDDPLEDFPSAEPPRVVKDDNGVAWSRVERAESYRVDQLIYENGQPHEIRAGRLAWNSERSKLIVIDGQHRAMALIGIDRTINNKWAGRGEKYRAFYEGPVQKCLEQLTPAQRESLFSSIELPVTLIWFPELTTSHQVAARKVFVDLNKNARPPSESRILILSDSNLISVFTRATLNEFRKSEISFPIYAVEYDHPENEQASQSKWSVITNVTVIADCIRRLVEGPSKFYAMNSSFGGNEKGSERAELLRLSLNIADVLPASIKEEDAHYEREKIDAKSFPRSSVDKLEQQYLQYWGRLLTLFFSSLYPYRCHADALAQLKDGWTTASAAAALARDAIFEGVGIYWTLRASDSYREDLARQARLSHQPVPARTDVHDAWRIIQEKREEFQKSRAQRFLGKESQVKESEAAYAMFSTSACQLGFVLAARALGSRTSITFSQVPMFCETVVDAANSALGANRQLVFVKDPSVVKRQPFNLLGNLDTPRAIYFRYMWMELLAAPEGRAVLAKVGADSNIDALVSIGRSHYRNFLIDDLKKSIKKQFPGKQDSQVYKEAVHAVDKQLSGGLKRWFQVDQDTYTTWKNSVDALSSADSDPSSVAQSQESAEVNDEGSLNDPGSASAPDLDDLIYDDGSED